MNVVSSYGTASSKWVNSQRKFEEMCPTLKNIGPMSDIVVRTGPADVLAPFGAKASAGIVMTKLKGQRNCEESMSALRMLLTWRC